MSPPLSTPAPPAWLTQGWAKWALLCVLGLAASGWLGAAGSVSGPAQWSQQTEQWINQQLLTQLDPDLPLRPEVEVGRFDSRLRLAPCQRVEPFLPAGTRLWGRTRIGLRCTQGPVAWSVFLPIQVRVWGPSWALRQPVAAGTPLRPEDVEQTETDWAASNALPLTQTAQWLGLAANQTLQPGQVLRSGMVRAPQVFASGSQVRLAMQGPGFSLYAAGTALQHGILGQTVRVRLPNRKVVSGVVRDEQTVEVRL